jgi:hypothetical protein
LISADMTVSTPFTFELWHSRSERYDSIGK